MHAYVTRFAPSPTGHLHLGHAYAAGFAHQVAKESGGRFLVRLEDIDGTRVRTHFEQDLLEDLRWLGLRWEEPVMRQSDRLHLYQAALDQLRERGLLYPCFCTRREIQEELARAASAPQGPDGPLYPGMCRQLSSTEQAEKIDSGLPYCLRLDITAAMGSLTGELEWTDLSAGQQVAQPQVFGDVVLARKEVPTSYHLAVVVDDAAQGITCVTRGEDLFAASHLHRLLQELLRLPVPVYHHHRLILDSVGKRLAKRDAALSLRALKAEGKSPESIWEDLGMRL
jgi:glutamyl-Q tRNA(Asp) synthetase